MVISSTTSLFRSRRPPAEGLRRGGAALFGVFLLGLIGLALLGLAVLMPVGLRGIDPAVLAEAGRGTAAFDRAGQSWFDAGKPGTAALFEKAGARLEMEGGDLPIVPLRERSGEEPILRLWGGADPFLEQVFIRYQPEPVASHPPVLPLFVPRQARQELRSFLGSSRHPGVRAVLANRAVQEAEQFMPVSSSAGQPLEATLYLTALLLQGNHVSQELADEIRRLAERASEENRLGEIEGVYLDLLTLGSRLQWQALADLMPLLDDRRALRRTAHLFKVLEGDWAVFAAASLWTRSPSELSRYLVAEGESGMSDLKRGLRLGEGAVLLLLERQEKVNTPAWRTHIPWAPVLLADLGVRAPLETSVLKLSALFLGLLMLLVALNLFFQVEAAGKTLDRPFVFTLLQSLLLAAALGMTFLFFTEPLLAQEGQKSEFRLSLPISFASTEAQLSTEEGLSINMDQLTIISLSIFFALQLIIYIICWIKVMEIRRQPIASHLKLKLLENEDHLFDAGLYIGLAGTVGALIFLAVGIIGPSLMAAYASTLFGIVFVAFFKICHLRPYRRRLIIESQTYA